MNGSLLRSHAMLCIMHAYNHWFCLVPACLSLWNLYLYCIVISNSMFQINDSIRIWYWKLPCMIAMLIAIISFVNEINKTFGPYNIFLLLCIQSTEVSSACWNLSERFFNVSPPPSPDNLFQFPRLATLPQNLSCWIIQIKYVASTNLSSNGSQELYFRSYDSVLMMKRRVCWWGRCSQQAQSHPCTQTCQ